MKTINIAKNSLEDPSSVFVLIKQEKYDEVKDLILSNSVSINTVDNLGNDVLTRLFKAKQYDLVVELMMKKNWDVNHQNFDGNTFGHIVAYDNSFASVKVFEQLIRKTRYLPNIVNDKGLTAMDVALNNNYLCTAFKILEDKRFDNIDMLTIRNLFDVSIKNKTYGKYSKLANLEIIVENLEKKELDDTVKDFINNIVVNMSAIKNDIINNKSIILEKLINSYLINEG